MKYRMFLAALIVSIITFISVGCGVPKTEHGKVVKELQKVNEEKAAISAKVDKLNQEKDSLVQQVSQLQAQVDTLRKENEKLKGKQAPKKPAQKGPAKTPAKKKK